FANHVETVGIGQAEIDDDQVGFARRGFDETLLAGLGVVYDDALAFQRGAHEAANLFFVFDQDDGNARVTHGRASKSADWTTRGTNPPAARLRVQPAARRTAAQPYHAGPLPATHRRVYPRRSCRARLP